VGKLEVLSQLGEVVYVWVNTKMVLKETGRRECTRCTWLRTEKCRAVVNTVTNFRVP